MKSGEDNHGSVCAVSGVLTPPGEEERKKGAFDSVERNAILAFCHKVNSCGRKKQQKLV